MVRHGPRNGRKFSPQSPACSMQPSFDRAFGRAQVLGQLLVAPMFGVFQQAGSPLRGAAAGRLPGEPCLAARRPIATPADRRCGRRVPVGGSLLGIATCQFAPISLACGGTTATGSMPGDTTKGPLSRHPPAAPAGESPPAPLPASLHPRQRLRPRAQAPPCATSGRAAKERSASRCAASLIRGPIHVADPPPALLFRRRENSYRRTDCLANKTPIPGQNFAVAAACVKRGNDLRRTPRLYHGGEWVSGERPVSRAGRVP